jgi:hypothetical protein
MEVIGNSASTGASLYGNALHSAVVPMVHVPDAVFRFDAVRDGWLTGGPLPSDGFTGDWFLPDGVPFDDDLNAMVPEDPFPGGEYADGVFPEDPFPELLDDTFPELLSNDHLFADATGAGAASGAGGSLPGADTPPASGLNLDNRVGAAKSLLRADLGADGPGLIDQTTALEKFKSWATGQQARLAVEFDARQRQEQAEFGTVNSPAQAAPGQATSSSLSAEELGRKRPKEPGLGVAEQIALARG